MNDNARDYRVERTTEGREVYIVTASTPEEAAQNWMSGELLVSEVLSSEFYGVEEDD